jgi:glycosyltransferase involved in cell wall biosynthesis
MACARPIVIAIDGATRDLVCERSRAGVFAEPGNGRSIADAIRYLADDPERRADLGSNGRRWVEQNESRETLAAKYLGLLETLVGKK